ncbi:LTA synthase family protein [Paenibacillaceae bacterium]|nr:LTA synthase family protein [Paenibacillaceae bacterium]
MRSGILELIIFISLLLNKLYLFDKSIAIPNMRMGADDVIIAVGTLGLISCWTLLLPVRGRMVALTVLNLILTLILYADLVYFRYFQDLISVPVLLQAGQVGALGDSIGSLLAMSDLRFFADLPFVMAIAVYFLLRKCQARMGAASNSSNASIVGSVSSSTNDSIGVTMRARSRRRSFRWRSLLARTMLLAVIAGVSLALVVMPINHAKRTWAQGLFVGIWWNVSLYNVTGLFGFHGYDIYQYAKQQWFSDNTLPEEQMDEIAAWLDEHGERRASLESDKLFGAYSGSNVIMIQAEAMQNFMIGQTYQGQEITPHLNRLVEQSVYFSQFYHQTAQGRTSDADFAAQCSMLPLPTGSVFIRYAHNTFDCLPGILSSNGFETSISHAYEAGFWNRNAMYATMGYNHYYSKKDFTLDEPLGWTLGDKSFFRQTADRMLEHSQPFYSFLITLTSHHPYPLPASQQPLKLGELDGTMFGDYLQAVHYTDAALGELVEKLKEDGLWDKTMLLYYGDHDNSVRDWEPFELFLDRPLSELEREQMVRQVPLLVHLPDNAYAGTSMQVGGQVDLAPTILHLLGISTKNKAMLGTPLLTEQPLADHTVIFRNGAYAQNERYFIPSSDGLLENGRCFQTMDGSETNLEACLPGAEQARQELANSDLTITYDVLAKLRKRN